MLELTYTEIGGQQITVGSGRGLWRRAYVHRPKGSATAETASLPVFAVLATLKDSTGTVLAEAVLGRPMSASLRNLSETVVLEEAGR